MVEAQDKFTYYDFIADVVPGMIFIGVLNYITPIRIFGNLIADSVYLIFVSYVFGLIIQFFSKYTVEKLVKFTFWKNSYLSDIFLIKDAHKIGLLERKKYLMSIKKIFKYSDSELKRLDEKNIFNKENRPKLDKAKEVSRSIYRALDCSTLDKNLAQKAHMQNTYYSLFRGLSMTFLFVSLLIAYFIIFLPHIDVLIYWVFFGLSVIFSIVFLIRIKQKGESYIKGLFDSITSKR